MKISAVLCIADVVESVDAANVVAGAMTDNSIEIKRIVAKPEVFFKIIACLLLYRKKYK